MASQSFSARGGGIAPANWAKDNRMLSVRRPLDVVVLNS
jgi:hypothetical protein